MRLDASPQPLPLSPAREVEARAPQRAAVPREDAAESSAGSRQRPAVSREVVEALALLNARQQRQADGLNDVPARNRAAVAAYLANVPGPLERLGVELAGIDVTA